jgi:hypothetical protein
MVPQLPAFLFVFALTLLASRTASGEGSEVQHEPPAAKIIQAGPHTQSVQAERPIGISLAQKTGMDSSTAKPGLKHSDYRLREKGHEKSPEVTRLARTSPETPLNDVDRMPVATVRKHAGTQRAPTESIPATAWAWALIPIGMGLVLFPLRRNYRRSTIRP